MPSYTVIERKNDFSYYKRERPPNNISPTFSRFLDIPIEKRHGFIIYF